MNKGVLFLGGLFFGGFLGHLSAKVMLEEKYRIKTDEDVRSVKEIYGNVVTDLENKIEKMTTSDDLEMDGYTRKNVPRKSNEDEVAVCTVETILDTKMSKKKGIFVISPDEFGEEEGYETINLTLYADNTITDDDFNKMSPSEVSAKIGLGLLEHFGEYEKDSMFVRNDELECYYEILKDSRDYSDILEDRPYLGVR